jgi:hypothetical protein
VTNPGVRPPSLPARYTEERIPEEEAVSRSLVVLLAILGSIIIVPPARAQRPIESANEILPGCRAFIALAQGNPAIDELGLIRGGVCAGKVSAVLNLAPILQPTFRFCKPEEATIRQTIEVVLLRLELNPDVWQQSFDALALSVFVDIWPCR